MIPLLNFLRSWIDWVVQSLRSFSKYCNNSFFFNMYFLGILPMISAIVSSSFSSLLSLSSTLLHLLKSDYFYYCRIFFIPQGTRSSKRVNKIASEDKYDKWKVNLFTPASLIRLSIFLYRMEVFIMAARSFKPLFNVDSYKKNANRFQHRYLIRCQFPLMLK